MDRTSSFSAFGISIFVHAAILIALAMVQLQLLDEDQNILIETVLSDERDQQEFSQDLEDDQRVAENLNLITGGTVSDAVGAAVGPTASKQKIETSQTLQNPEIRVNQSNITVPGNESLGDDLGEGEVTGEVGAIVDGYGAAMSRLTQEMLRMMREQRVLVVWLFDESESMKDDREEIAAQFDKVYEELEIAQEQDAKIKKRVRKGQETLLTSIIGYGEKMHYLTPNPTTDISAVRAAIRRVAIDDSGKENMCQTISAAIKKYRTMALKQRRKLVIVVVTDESGDDGATVETTIAEAKRIKTPIYVMGREAVFGFQYARIRWQDPKFKLWHWIQVKRGPETAWWECLQWDGLRQRYDAFQSGFGPYEQVRLAKETGGIFFLLPGEEEDLTGPGAKKRRKFDFLAMKEYQPLLLPRRIYEQERSDSDFRKTTWAVIQKLNPQEDDQLNIKEIWYPLEPTPFKEEAAKQVVKAARAMVLCNQAVNILEKIRPLREAEQSQRWRASYDLMFAQILAYRVRLFQFLLAMDNHVNNPPKPTKSDSNIWSMRRVREMLVPDENQFERIKRTFNVKVDREEYLAELKHQEQWAREVYELCKANHPGTPWARRADYELNNGFGMRLQDGFRNPNYTRTNEIKLPKL